MFIRNGYDSLIIKFIYTEKKIGNESNNPPVIVQSLITTRSKVQITRDWEVANVKTVEIVTLVTIDAVVIDYRAESLAVMLVATKGIVKAKIDMEIEIDMMVAVIDETSGITIIESKIGLAVPREDHVVLFEPDQKENETIGTKDPDLLLEVVETETNNRSGIMLETAKRIETETASENAAISIRILYRKVSR